MLDIPGYRIQRQIGAGGSAQVHLALQHAFGRPVAIKALAADAARPAAYRRRFLREAEIAKGLDHPNIVRILDFGVHADTPYIVMEYLRGGDLNANAASGLHMQNVVMAVKEIATALDYAHRKGVFHGDVKPENILFNEQGSALLADFGIAALAEEDPEPSAPVLGTPPFMSPERRRGEPVDGRGDLFSLGVVLCWLLTGQLPFDDASGAAGALREPSLPLRLAPFQGVARKALAAAPADRYQTGAEFAAALDRVRAAGLVPDGVVRTAAVTTTDIEAALAAEQRQGEGRGAAPAARTAPGYPLIVLGVLLVVAIGAGAWSVASSPGGLGRLLAQVGWVEHPDAVRAWQEARALEADPTQGLAAVVAAYRGVLVHDAGHAGAAAGVAAATARWKQEVESALVGGDAGHAAAKLDELAEVFPADPALPTLFDGLADLRQAQRLVTDTSQLLASSGLDDAAAVESAIDTYKEALRLTPSNAEASDALRRIAEHYGALAERNAEARNFTAAIANFRRAVEAAPDFQGVEAVRTVIADAEEVLEQMEDYLQQAARHREAGALIAPPNANAVELYRLVLATKPDDAIAVQGLAEVAQQVAGNFRALLSEGRLGDARGLLERAAASGLGDAPVGEMQASYDAELARLERVRSLVERAETLVAVGYITGPATEDNAVVRLREVLRLDPNNADALRLLSLAATRLSRVAEDAYRAGMTEEGLRYLNLALTVTPGIARWQDMRRRWEAESKDAAASLE